MQPILRLGVVLRWGLSAGILAPAAAQSLERNRPTVYLIYNIESLICGRGRRDGGRDQLEGDEVVQTLGDIVRRQVRNVALGAELPHCAGEQCAPGRVGTRSGRTPQRLDNRQRRALPLLGRQRLEPPGE